jgi:tetratricopeptide (TPR) repeat protein
MDARPSTPGPTSPFLILPLCLCAAVLLNVAAPRNFPPAFPNLAGMRLRADDAMRTCAFAALGMRRLAADLDFIRLMMYYGSAEEEAPEEHEEAGPHVHMRFGSGQYPDLGPRTLRIMDLDPYFAYAPLYTAGALAFNLGRPEEAIQLLDAALKWDPHQWKYRAYIAGIGSNKKGNPAEAVQLLTPVLSDPECPVLLKNMVAFLDRKLGRRSEAIRIYLDILNSRDPSYSKMARRALRELGAPIPE